MLNLIWETRLLGTLLNLPVLAVLGTLIAAVAGLRMTWRVCREDADRDRSLQVLTFLAQHSFETIALTFLIGFTMVVLGLCGWYFLLDSHPVSPPALIRVFDHIPSVRNL